MGLRQLPILRRISVRRHWYLDRRFVRWGCFVVASDIVRFVQGQPSLSWLPSFVVSCSRGLGVLFFHIDSKLRSVLLRPFESFCIGLVGWSAFSRYSRSFRVDLVSLVR